MGKKRAVIYKWLHSLLLSSKPIRKLISWWISSPINLLEPLWFLFFFSLVFSVIFSMIYLWIKPNDIEVFLGKLNSNPINLYLLSSPTQQKQQNPKRHKKIYNKEEAATAKYAKKHILRHFRWEAENQKRNRNQKPSQWIETDLLNRCHTRNIIICQSKSTLCVIQLLLFTFLVCLSLW